VTNNTINYLIHHALLSVSIGVLHGVQSIQQTGLFGSGRSRGIIRSGRCVSSRVGVVASGRVARRVGVALSSYVLNIISNVSSGAVVMTSAAIVLGQARGTAGTSASDGATVTTECSSHSLGLAGKGVSTLLTAAQGTTLALEFRHGDWGEGRGGVVLGLILVHLVNGDGGVDDGGLDNLFLDDGLDSLVNVMVDVLACNDTGIG